MSRQSRRFAKSRQTLEGAADKPLPAARRRAATAWRAWGSWTAAALLAAAIGGGWLMMTRHQSVGAAWAWAMALLGGGAAAGLAWRRFQSRLGAAANIQRMEWVEFQPLLCQALELQGYRLAESGNRPGVVDLVLRKDRQTYLVHAKSWKGGKLGLHEVRELYAAMVTRGAPGGMVVSAGSYGRVAMQFARETQIVLVDGALLRQWLAKRPLPASPPTSPQEAEEEARTEPGATRPQAIDTQLLSEFAQTKPPDEPPVPDCPLCGAPMRLRTARKGRHAGSKFWGCTRHPLCKGISRLKE